MTEAWAAIIAAIAAGVFGVGGAFVGIIVGRRQTMDQAHVEHAQWLREQRLQAYTEVFTVWDGVIKDLRAFQEGWAEEVESFQQHGGPLHPSVIAGRKTDEAWEALWLAIERVVLLGPLAVFDSVEALQGAWRDMDQVLCDQGCAEPYDTLWERWEQARVTGEVARTNFHIAVSNVLQTPPSLKGGRLP